MSVAYSFGTGLFAALLRCGLVECTGLNRSHPSRGLRINQSNLLSLNAMSDLLLGYGAKTLRTMR